MRRLVFGGDDADLDFFEAGGFEPAVQVAFRKTQPTVAIKFMRLVEIVLEQIKNQNLAAGFEQLRRTRQGRRRITFAGPAAEALGGIIAEVVDDLGLSREAFDSRRL